MSLNYEFDLPVKNSFIKVIGVGGGGGNAAKNMYTLGIRGVDFIVCNTDMQALDNSPIPKKLALGQNLTGGLGAGANPEVGRNAAIESTDDIKAMLSDGTKMLFITAGMGGGTGTGAAPIIAQIANSLDILTVGIVTMPFSFEGKKKLEQAQLGIKELREHCDTVLVILNDRIKDILGNLTIGTAFAKADEVQTTAAKSIAEIITVPGYVNVDFEDVKTVMRKAGTAVMGSATEEGENRAMNAVKAALSSPLLEYRDIHGAKKILLSIVFGTDNELSMEELSIITDYIRDQIGDDAEMIFGYGSDENVGNGLRITIIATGFSDKKNENIRVQVQKKVQSYTYKRENNLEPSIEKNKSKGDFILNQNLNLDKDESDILSEKIVLEKNELLIPTYKRLNISIDFSSNNNFSKRIPLE